MPNANEIFQLGNLPRTFEAYDSNGTLIEVINISSSGVFTFSDTTKAHLGINTSVLTKGSGVSAAETYAVGYSRVGTLVTTRMVVDLTGLVGSATDLDIIGNTGGAANCHWGQITTARNGTMCGGMVTCLEVPAGGAGDIDFYSATEATGAQDALVTGLTETALITSGGNWTSGSTKGMTAVPADNEYLYICNGAASGGTFSAGKFLIQLFGYVA